jgi:hypothetical protein
MRFAIADRLLGLTAEHQPAGDPLEQLQGG